MLLRARRSCSSSVLRCLFCFVILFESYKGSQINQLEFGQRQQSRRKGVQ